MEDPIEKALVGSQSNDQFESECMSFKDLSSERGMSNSIMHVGHWTPTFELLASSSVKPVFSEEQLPILDQRMCIDYRNLKKSKMKFVHDQHILSKSFEIGQKGLLYNS